MTRKPSKEPLIAIIGATGTGKSQLAVELAKRFNGEIINGDAMQLYAGLPIITNKISVEEQEGIPHHLLGCIGLQEQTWVVGTFVRRALKLIDAIRSRGRLPILVGGTHYYTQSLLFHDRLAEADSPGDGSGEEQESRQHWPILGESTEVLYTQLQQVDPVMADRWHPRDRRKIQRSLEIYLKTGRKASDIYAEQQERKGIPHGELRDVAEDGTTAASSMRFQTLLFWLHLETEALRERLDKRVDKMLEAGLLDEVWTLNAHAEAETLAGRPPDQTRGVWVSIGYKEFRGYAQALESGSVSDTILQKLKVDAIERTKIATRQYATRQLKWIRIKLLNALSEAQAMDQLYLLDGSNVTQFDDHAVEPAAALTKDFLQLAPLPEPSSLAGLAAKMLKPSREYDVLTLRGKSTKQHCEVCNVTCVIEDQWQQHIKGKAHEKLVSKQRQQEVKAHNEEAHSA